MLHDPYGALQVFTQPIAAIFDGIATLAPGSASLGAWIVGFVRAAPIVVLGGIIVNVPLIGVWTAISNWFDAYDQRQRELATTELATAR